MTNNETTNWVAFKRPRTKAADEFLRRARETLGDHRRNILLTHAHEIRRRRKATRLGQVHLELALRELLLPLGWYMGWAEYGARRIWAKEAYHEQGTIKHDAS